MGTSKCGGREGEEREGCGLRRLVYGCVRGLRGCDWMRSGGGEGGLPLDAKRPAVSLAAAKILLNIYEDEATACLGDSQTSRRARLSDLRG